MDSGIASPPPEDISGKAAKVLGVGAAAAAGAGLARSASKKSKGHGKTDEPDAVATVDEVTANAAPAAEEDLTISGANEGASASPDKAERRRSKVHNTTKKPKRVHTFSSRRLKAKKPANRKHTQHVPGDDDIVMVDAADATPSMKRSQSVGKSSRFSGLFSRLQSATKPESSRPENRRRSTFATTDDEGVARSHKAEEDVTVTDGEAEKRREARRARRAERDASNKAADDAQRAKEENRREKRRKQDDDNDARRQEERDARRAERRTQKLRDEADRQDADERDAGRSERKKLRKERDADGETPTRPSSRNERRKSGLLDGDRDRTRERASSRDRDDDQERRRRREAKRAARDAEAAEPGIKERLTRRLSKRRDDGNGGGYVYPREKSRGASKKAWPHSGGTDSWVKEHSDAPPPPEDGEGVPDADGHRTEGEADDEEAARRKRRAARRRSMYDAPEPADDDAQRRRRARERERERERDRDARTASDGSDDRKHRHGSVFGEGATPRSSWWKKIAGR
jgi:hypothetical protein